MKKLVILAASAISMALYAAYIIQGIDSTAIGNSAGKDAYAHRTVVIGTGAGAYMNNCDSNLFVGAASGLLADNVKATVGIGHFALRGATNIQESVGIGDNAMTKANGLTRCVGIGQGVFAGRRDAHDEVNINNQIVVGEWEGSGGTYKGVLIRDSNGIDVFKSYEERAGVKVMNFEFGNDLQEAIFIVPARIQANDLYLYQGIYLKKGEDGKVHVYEGDTDLGYITPTK